MKLPVIVHVYGGGYTVKAGEMYPEYFMDEDVVFVTFNYRLTSIGKQINAKFCAKCTHFGTN